MIANLLLIQQLPTYIRELFDNDINKLASCTSILDASVSDGMVYKIVIEDNVKEGYQTSYLYLLKGSSIDECSYEGAIEYMIIEGDSTIEDQKFPAHQVHKLGPVSEDTLIYVHREKKHIKQKVNHIFITEEQKKDIY